MTYRSTASRTTANLLTFGVVLLAFALHPEAMAQEEGGADSLTLKNLILQGGWAMIPLGICSLAVITLFVYNGIQLIRSKFAPLDVQAAVMEQMQACRVRSAIEISATSPTFLGRMLAHSLPKVDATDPDTLGRDHVEDAMAEFTTKESRGYMTWIGYFSILAQVSPMIGLLGTVSGMIKAFAKLQQEGGANPESLAGNISEALVTTATGLIVAIPALFGYFFFKNKLTRLIADSHSAETDMLEASIHAVNADQYMAKVPEGLQVS